MSNEDDVMDEGNMQTRHMEIPEWLSTPEVTSKFVLSCALYSRFVAYSISTRPDKFSEFLVGAGEIISLYNSLLVRS